LIEKEASVAKVINDRIVSADETKARYESLIHQKPILEVKNIQTWFPTKTNILGKTTRICQSCR
jgi:GR25 family glycosyltransferase involved in LPS biosynthesis